MNCFSLSISPHGEKTAVSMKNTEASLQTFMAEDSKEEAEASRSSVETPLCLAGLGEFPFLSAVFLFVLLSL